MISESKANQNRKLDSLMLIYETSYSFEKNPDLLDYMYIEFSKGNIRPLVGFLYSHESKIKKSGSKQEIIKVYSYLSESYVAVNNLDSCLYFANKAFKMSNEISDELIVANSQVV